MRHELVAAVLVVADNIVADDFVDVGIVVAVVAVVVDNNVAVAAAAAEELSQSKTKRRREKKKAMKKKRNLQLCILQLKQICLKDQFLHFNLI